MRLFGPQVDSIMFYKKKLDDLDAIIKESQSQFAIDTPKYVDVGFITFTSFKITTMAAQTIFSHNVEKMKVRLAPDPIDINWPWISKKIEHLTARKIILAAALILLFLFWSIPVAAVSAILNLGFYFFFFNFF